jgi:N-acetylglucosamine transport system permease protein
MKKNKLKKPSLGAKPFLVIFFIIFLVYGFTLLYPLLWALINAGKSSVDYFSNTFAIPKQYLFRNFIDAFQNFVVSGASFAEMLWNTTWMSLLSTFVSVGCSTIAAYVVARYNFPGRNLVFTIAILVQIVPIVGAGASQYELFYNLGMLNNPLLYWLAWAGGFNFNFVILYGYFKSISREYEEAAIMDGCGDWKIFTKLMIPMARPSIVSLMILGVIGMWGDYNTSLLYMKDYPQIGLGIYMFQTESRFLANSMPTLFAAIIITIIPVLVVFSMTQKMIMTNVTAGGLKG